MINTIYTTKTKVTQAWNTKGVRMPVTILKADPMLVSQLKTKDKDGYDAVQVAISSKKSKDIAKPLSLHLKKANIGLNPKALQEIKGTTDDLTGLFLGQAINAADLLVVGDVVKATGVSKGKGFAGVVKRWHFRGGPRTHGQSDRERAPGSIGQGTTPGRVWKNKKMAGRMGQDNVSVANLVVIKLAGQEIWLKGTIPGSRGGIIRLVKTGQSNFPGIHGESTPAVPETNIDTTTQQVEEKQNEG
jgi:large subunit ribosomal protein L3